MIGKLFGAAWQHWRPVRRIKAIGAFSETDPRHQESLAALARTAPEAAVRDAAIARLLDCRLLAELMLQGLSGAAAARLNFLIRSNESAHRACVSDYSSHAGAGGLIEIACHSPHPQTRAAALQRLVAEEQIAAVAAAAEFADTRECAASRVERFDLLETLWKQVRKRDKSLARTLQGRLQTLRQQQQQGQQLTAQAEKVIAALAELKVSVWTPQYKLRWLALVKQWQAVASSVSAAQAARYSQLAGAVEAVVTEHRRIVETPEQQQQLLAAAEQLQQEALSLSFSALAEQLQHWHTLQQCWLEALALVAPNAAAGQRFERVQSFFAALSRLLQQQAAATDQTPAAVEVTAPAIDPDAMTAAPDAPPAPENSAATAAPATDQTPAATVPAQHEDPARAGLKQQIAGLEAALQAIDWPPALPPPVRLTELRAGLQERKVG